MARQLSCKVRQIRTKWVPDEACRAASPLPCSCRGPWGLAVFLGHLGCLTDDCLTGTRQSGNLTFRFSGEVCGWCREEVEDRWVTMFDSGPKNIMGSRLYIIRSPESLSLLSCVYYMCLCRHWVPRVLLIYMRLNYSSLYLTSLCTIDVLQCSWQPWNFID